jgi:hypothetical protein
MPGGSALTQGSLGEVISHITGVRMRVVGSGSLQMTLFSLDDIRSQALVPFTLAASTNIEPFRLANFMEQRTALEIKTTNINEWFRINRVIVFAKPKFTMYPG